MDVPPLGQLVLWTQNVDPNGPDIFEWQGQLLDPTTEMRRRQKFARHFSKIALNAPVAKLDLGDDCWVVQYHRIVGFRRQLDTLADLKTTPRGPEPAPTGITLYLTRDVTTSQHAEYVRERLLSFGRDTGQEIREGALDALCEVVAVDGEVGPRSKQAFTGRLGMR